MLSLNSPLEISMEKNYRGELFWSIAAQKGILPSIEDGLRSLYGQVKLEPIPGQQEQFPYKSRAFLQRNLCKEENGRKEIETDPVFNWPSAVAGAMLSGSFRVKIRIRKRGEILDCRQMKETVRQYNHYGDYLSVSVQGSANGSISVSKKADFKEGMSTRSEEGTISLPWDMAYPPLCPCPKTALGRTFFRRFKGLWGKTFGSCKTGSLCGICRDRGGQGRRPENPGRDPVHGTCQNFFFRVLERKGRYRRAGGDRLSAASLGGCLFCTGTGGKFPRI